jgi:hypothetical protein
MDSSPHSDFLYLGTEEKEGEAARSELAGESGEEIARGSKEGSHGKQGLSMPGLTSLSRILSCVTLENYYFLVLLSVYLPTYNFG